MGDINKLIRSDWMSETQTEQHIIQVTIDPQKLVLIKSQVRRGLKMVPCTIRLVMDQVLKRIKNTFIVRRVQ